MDKHVFFHKFQNHNNYFKNWYKMKVQFLLCLVLVAVVYGKENCRSNHDRKGEHVWLLYIFTSSVFQRNEIFVIKCLYIVCESFYIRVEFYGYFQLHSPNVLPQSVCVNRITEFDNIERFLVSILICTAFASFKRMCRSDPSHFYYINVQHILGGAKKKLSFRAFLSLSIAI